MSVLMMRLCAPMQSWGVGSRFGIRDTGLEPSKSGVLGILCAALGKPRDEDETGDLPKLVELAALRMGVRVLREGVPKVDYHTAGGTHRQGDKYGVVTAKGGTERTTVQSWRHYLSDADFLVGLESSDEKFLTRLDEALARPRWQLSLGRKSFAPALPVRAGMGGGTLENALREYQPPFTSSTAISNSNDASTRLVIEVDETEGGADVRVDVPVSFAKRAFLPRKVRTTFY